MWRWDYLAKHLDGSTRQLPNCELLEEDFDALYNTENLVYLTADSPNVLETLDAGKKYIIGGLVDRNRYKVILRVRLLRGSAIR